MSGISYEAASGPPGIRIYAIGDIHGRFDLLQEMHRKIGKDLARRQPADWRVIHLGDYVDRGPQSRDVIEFLLERQNLHGPDRIVALVGNHDQGFLDFMESTEGEMLFARFGGDTTAASYGVDADFTSPATRQKARDDLRYAVPPSHLAFLGSLSRAIDFGDFFFCHAGIRPGLALDAQDPTDLIWIRDEFLDDERLHEKVVVHGHTPVSVAEIRRNRVNLDTRAYATGRMMALVIEEAEKDLIEIRGSPAE